VLGLVMFPTMFSCPYQSHFAILVEILAIRRLSRAVLSHPTAQHPPVYGPEGQSDSIIYTWLPDPAIGQVCHSYKRAQWSALSQSVPHRPHPLIAIMSSPPSYGSVTQTNPGAYIISPMLCWEHRVYHSRQMFVLCHQAGCSSMT